jgi:hypothetical protein
MALLPRFPSKSHNVASVRVSLEVTEILNKQRLVTFFLNNIDFIEPLHRIKSLPFKSLKILSWEE